jgi:hypothetical protein
VSAAERRCTVLPPSRAPGAPLNARAPGPRHRLRQYLGLLGGWGSLGAIVLAVASCSKDRAERSGPGAAASASGSAARIASASTAPSAAPSAEPPTDSRPSFEVELEGVIKTPVQMKAARYVAIVTPEACTLDNLATVETLAIGEGRPRPVVRKFWTEGNVREGTQAWICVFGLDPSGAVIGFGTSPRNPLTLRGGGKNEIEVEDLDVTLQPVAPPRSLGQRTF